MVSVEAIRVPWGTQTGSISRRSGGDVIERLLSRTQTGVYCRSRSEVKAAIREFYSQYESKGYVSYAGCESSVVSFSYANIARDYAHVLDEVAQKWEMSVTSRGD